MNTELPSNKDIVAFEKLQLRLKLEVALEQFKKITKLKSFENQEIYFSNLKIVNNPGSTREQVKMLIKDLNELNLIYCGFNLTNNRGTK